MPETSEFPHGLREHPASPVSPWIERAIHRRLASTQCETAPRTRKVKLCWVNRKGLAIRKSTEAEDRAGPPKPGGRNALDSPVYGKSNAAAIPSYPEGLARLRGEIRSQGREEIRAWSR